MTKNEVIERLNSVKNRRWPSNLFVKSYGLDFWDLDSSIGAQFLVWAKRFRDGAKFLGTNDVDRWMFERFIVQREWVPMRVAADQLAMSTDDLKKVLRAMTANLYISKGMANGDVPGIFPKSLVRNLPKRLPSFPRKVFSSQSNFVRAFHEAIKKDLPEVSVDLLLCSASEKLGEDPPEVAYERDIITDLPIGISHQIWLDFGKPLALKPDACSVITFVQHDEVLRTYTMGLLEDQEIEAARVAVRRLEKR